MRVSDLTKVWVCSPNTIKTSGEYSTTWSYEKEVHLNLQQDINELDTKSSGEINYEIVKARIDRELNLKNGWGIKLSKDDEIPTYRILDQSKIGRTVLYRMEKYNGN